MRRLALWILSFDRGLQHWWAWLRAIGYDPGLPQLVVRSQSRGDYTGHGWPASIPTPWPPPVDPHTITGWQLIWYATTPPGSELFGKHGAGNGVAGRILCILEFHCEA